MVLALHAARGSRLTGGSADVRKWLTVARPVAELFEVGIVVYGEIERMEGLFIEHARRGV